MKRVWTTFFPALAVAAIVFLAFENLLSKTFKDCIGKPPSANGAGGAYEHSLVFVQFAFREFVCTLHVIDVHNGFFTLIGSIAVAFFTYTLWQSTESLVRSASEAAVIARTQTEILNRQTKIAEKHNIVYGPVVGMGGSKTLVKANKIKPSTLDYIEVRLVFKNFGPTAAVNVCYRMGQVHYQDYANVDASVWEAFRPTFDERIFRITTKQAGVFIPTGHTEATDAIRFDLENLRAMFSKKKHAFAWIVFTYESLLEEAGWFAEEAMFLEFVMIGDPDNFPTESKALPMADPIQIAVRAQRNRQDRYQAS